MLSFLSAIFGFVSALLVEDLFFSIYFGSSNSFLLYDCENIVSFDRISIILYILKIYVEYMII